MIMKLKIPFITNTYKEDIDALFKDSSDNNTTEDSSPNVLRWIFFAITGIGTIGYGIYKKVSPAIKRKVKKNDGEAVKKEQNQISKQKRMLYEE